MKVNKNIKNQETTENIGYNIQGKLYKGIGEKNV